MKDETDRLNSIERKLDTLLVLIEGKHGTEGLVKQIYKNRDNIAVINRKILVASGAVLLITPLIPLVVRSLLA